MYLLNKRLTEFTFFICLVLMSPLASASSVIQMDVDQLLQTAELIFEGEVVESQSRFNSAGTAINTYVTFQIVDVINGEYTQPTIELSFAGGATQTLAMEVPGMIYPQLGEKGIYFVYEVSKAFVNPIVGWSQGHFLIKVDADGIERMSTAVDVPIIEMNDERAPAAAISQGVARGIQTRGSSAQASAAMLKSQFKQQLKNKMATRNRSN